MIDLIKSGYCLNGNNCFFVTKSNLGCRDLMFLAFDRLSRLGVPVRGSHYNKSYSGTLKSGKDLDSIYERFNLYHIINNGDRCKDDDEKKHSVMDKIQEKKKEAAVAENNAPKPKEAAKKQEAELS